MNKKRKLFKIGDLIKVRQYRKSDLGKIDKEIAGLFGLVFKVERNQTTNLTTCFEVNDRVYFIDNRGETHQLFDCCLDKI